jgi:hypothetical protein
MLSHPHATKTECGLRAGHYVAFRFGHVCGTVKDGTRLGQAPAGQDSLGPGDFQGRHWSREGRRLVQRNSLAEQGGRWLKAVHHLQRCCRLASRVHGHKSVWQRTAGSDEGMMRPAQQTPWLWSSPQGRSARMRIQTFGQSQGCQGGIADPFVDEV